MQRSLLNGKSNDIVYSDIVYSDIVYSDNAEYNYGSLSEPQP
jgi:hypothetical protein